MNASCSDLVTKRSRDECVLHGRRRRAYPWSKDDAVTDQAGSSSDNQQDAAFPSACMSNKDASDRVVILNVGGTVVTTLASTLSAYPSRFMQWLKSDFDDLPRDGEERPFIDRDYNTFRHVLNYLRGYGLPTKSEDLVLLAQDAVYYEFENMKTDIGINSPSIWRFNPGPGVQEDGTVFTVADILGLCGSEPLSTRQTHTIVFRIDKCELIEIGLIDLDHAKENRQVHHQRNSVCYCNTGDLIRYWSEEPLYTTGTPFKAQDLITVRIRFVHDNGIETTDTPNASTSEPAANGVNTVTGPTASALAHHDHRASDGNLAHPNFGSPGVTVAAREVNWQGATVAAFLSNDPYHPPISTRGRGLAGVQRYNAIHDTNSGSNIHAVHETNLVTSPMPLQEPASRSPSATAQNRSAISPPATDAESMDVVFAQSNLLTTATIGTPSDTATTTTLHTATTATTAGGNVTTEVEDTSTAIGAIITFSKENKVEFEARWPVPVPPLQFAVSMQGTSSVSIIDAISVDEDMESNLIQRHASSLYCNHPNNTSAIVRSTTDINADDIFAMLPISMTGST